ncbi:MAG: nucleotide-binding protein [Methanomicrobiales archaeon]|nr:nucleotide-binding protein [Methanomicrobiales archaeon]MDI6877437.1 nucleotide-binding protein [Methanomicrobiales archaeon]
MKIGNIRVKVSVIVMAVVAFFTILLIFAYFATGDLTIIKWGIPLLFGMILIPIALNYMSQSTYADMIPAYEKEAKKVRVRAINLNMLGDPIRIEGVVERVYFRFLNRPQYLIADRSGAISVKMFTSPKEDVKKGDVVEVLGSVMKRYIVTGDAVVNAVAITRVDREKSAPEKRKK